MASLDDQLDGSFIKVSDLEKMAIKDIDENTPPYERDAIKYNQSLFKDFIKEMVLPNVEEGKINCTVVGEMWGVYQEGKETEAMYALKDQLFDIPQDQVNFWKKVFDLPVEDMLKMGRSSLVYGFELLSLWYRKWLLEVKYGQFFKNPDPAQWFKLKDDIHNFEKNPQLYTKVDMNKYTKKMQSIMKLVITF